MTSRRGRSLMAGLLVAALAAAWAAWIASPHLTGRAGIIDGLEATLTDLRFLTFGPADPGGSVVIVAIDDASMARPEIGGRESRARLAALVDAIADAGPAVIGLDVILADPGDAASDAALAGALARSPAVIAAAGSFDAVPRDAGPPRTAQVLWPQDRFAAVADAALVNLVTDATGTPRHMPMLYMTERGLQQSLALRVAAIAAGADPVFSGDTLSLGSRAVPLDLGLQMPLRLLGPGGTLPTLSAEDVIDGRAMDRLAGKTVILGYTATAFGDRFPTPFDDDTPGVEIIATAVSQLAGGPSLQRDMRVRWLDAGLAVALAAACAAAVAALPLSAGVPVAAAMLAVAMLGVWLAFPFGLWLSAALPVWAVLPPVLASGILRHLRERRAARRSDAAMQALRRFQSPALADMIAGDPDFLSSPQSRDLTVFFIDLSGFTRISERLGPARTQDFLKRFHSLLTLEIERRNGIVFNFMGDGALAVFGMDGTGRTAAADAIATAFELSRQVPSMADGELEGEVLACRIGLHAGAVVLSRLGSEHHQQVSVAGDSVNLASRLMEIAKAEGACIAASAELMAALARRPARAPDGIKTVPVRGRQGEVRVHLWNADPR